MRRLALLLTTLVAVACTQKKTAANDRDTMTQRQRDSVLGQSGMPGAQGVTKAIRAADSLRARNAQIDSIAP